MRIHHPHHLRIWRRRAALSQRDIAFLLGVKAASKISRYERQLMLPSLRTVLAYQIIFDRPLETLFRGTYDAIRRDVRRRAMRLHATFANVPNLDRRRMDAVQSILSR